MKINKIVKIFWAVWFLLFYTLNIFDVIDFETMVSLCLLATMNVAFYNKTEGETK